MGKVSNGKNFKPVLVLFSAFCAFSNRFLKDVTQVTAALNTSTDNLEILG